ncbi:MAG: PAS domain-containing protein [Verrucomicrobiales bacterium]
MSPTEEERLELALQASNEGIWDWDARSGELVCSERILRFLGGKEDDLPNFMADVDEVIHPDDQAVFRRKLSRVIDRGGKLFAVEPRMKTASGVWKWFRVRGVPVQDEFGRVVRMVGSMIDISKRKRAEAALAEERELLDTLIENIPMNVYFKDQESRFVMANTATAQKMGLDSVAELLGKTDHDFFKSEHADHSRQHELEIMRTGVGEIEKLEQEKWTGKADTWVLTTKLPWKSREGKVLGTFGVTNDVTELVNAQADLKRVAELLHQTSKEVENERRLLRLVIDNVQVHVYFKDQDSRFVLVNRAMAKWFGVDDPDEMVGKRDRDFFSEEHWRKAEEDEQRIMETREPLVEKLERETWADREDTWAVTSKYPWLTSKGAIKGTFGVSNDVSHLVRTQRKLADVAEDLGRRNKLMQEELMMAREIQQALIPEELPSLEWGDKRVSLAKCYLPASELAGDFFEIIPLGKRGLGFVLCDVMGHGVRAALVVSMIRGLIEKQRSVADDPGQFLQGLNEGLSHLLEECGVTMFASAIYGMVDLEHGCLRLGLAGHPAPILIEESGGRIVKLEKGVKGPALGVFGAAHYGSLEIPLAGVKRFVCFTDGIFEPENEEGEEFGPQRLRKVFENEARLPELMEKARETALAFAGWTSFEDDVCLLGFEIE